MFVIQNGHDARIPCYPILKLEGEGNEDKGGKLRLWQK